MAYRPEADGTARVVPELAAAAPEVLDGGRTFVFRLRPGFRFSPPSGAPVTAQAVRFSLERALSPKLSNPYCSQVLSKLVGEDDYRAGKSDHISGIAIAGDRIRLSLVSPNSTLPAQLTAPCFSVVPIGTPTLPDGVFEPIPSAGPYYIDSHIDTEQLVLLPNPGYGGDRAKDSTRSSSSSGSTRCAPAASWRPGQPTSRSTNPHNPRRRSPPAGHTTVGSGQRERQRRPGRVTCARAAERTGSSS